MNLNINNNNNFNSERVRNHSSDNKRLNNKNNTDKSSKLNALKNAMNKKTSNNNTESIFKMGSVKDIPVIVYNPEDSNEENIKQHYESENIKIGKKI